MTAAGEVQEARGVADVLETDEARHLLEAAQAAGGSLSTEEIALALDELDLDAGKLDDFYHALAGLQIAVVNAAEAEEAEDEALKAEIREISTDSLQLFLKDIGKVELL